MMTQMVVGQQNASVVSVSKLSANAISYSNSRTVKSAGNVGDYSFVRVRVIAGQL
jgi:hypothetical protein